MSRGAFWMLLLAVAAGCALVVAVAGCGRRPDPWAAGCEDAEEFATLQEEPATANYLEVAFWRQEVCAPDSAYAEGFLTCWSDALGVDPCY